MSNLKMNCGYCGRKCSLEKDFCIPQDSVYVCKSCYEWQGKVADLEAKLAESEEKCNKQWLEIQAETHQIQMLEQDIKRIKKELKQQLAEKEKEIEVLKLDYDFVAKQYKELMRIGDFVIEQKDQDKISFAVEQLTEIRDYVKNCWSLDTTEGKVRLDIAKKIRLKIEQLTHQHEDKGE